MKNRTYQKTQAAAKPFEGRSFFPSPNPIPFLLLRSLGEGGFPNLFQHFCFAACNNKSDA